MFEVTVSAQPLTRTDERFLSVAIDVSQLVGRDWWSPHLHRRFSLTGGHHGEPIDLARDRLISLASLLAPAYLKIGGTTADDVFFAEHGETAAPAPYRLLLTPERWSELAAFAADCGFSLAMTLNALRDIKNAESLLRLAADRQDRVGRWFFGNEVNGFPLRGRRVDGGRYARSYRRAKKVLGTYFPEAKLIACSAAVWPILGELFPVTRRTVRELGTELDALSWHYYPSQSRRSPLAYRPAAIASLISPRRLDIDAAVVARRAALAPSGLELWCGETASAMCGGEPGVSDCFVSSLWWLCHLGELARSGHMVAVRQVLSGADYGLIDDRTLEPRPDFWASVLWKRFMGPAVYAALPENRRRSVRIFAHGSPDDLAHERGILLVNVGPEEAPVSLGKALVGREIAVLTAASLSASTVALNGVSLADAQQLSDLPLCGQSVCLPPFSAAFVRAEVV